MAIESYFEDIADAIRERGGTSATLTPAAMPQAILDIPGGASQILTPDFAALAYAYVALDGGFYSNTEKTNFLNLFTVKANHTYALFVGATVSNRRRCAFFQNMAYADFAPYLLNSYQNVLRFNSTALYAPYGSTDDTGTALEARVLCTPSSNGTIIYGSSNNSSIAPVFCADITEV